ncbi:SigE family RNA polymerase sigma factor [Nocardioides sp. Y6]|uniref:SigE family RNA polymerase sigma factor n=1 Tax=Nocardioides malaquae TaxID=2773426 RepID=A0ABR9RU49_9ACTN|nr:SigE family RNA polymerase sigma factor [Nocardioides malaquae]MBE7325079.1 SigE family RNA polymerase sigma factor [Nocardioides malaquae]
MGRTRTGPPADDDFADFVHARWPALYRSAVMLVGDRHLAEDLVQSALASTYANWGRIERTDSAPGYARRTLHNEAFTWMRRRGWRNEVPTEELPESSPEHRATRAVDDDPSVRPTVLAALRQLPPRQRAVVVLRYYDDLSVAETASILGVTTGTVKSQCSEALGRLGVLLGSDEMGALRAL